MSEPIVTGTLTDGLYQLFGYPHDFTGYILMYTIAGFLFLVTFLMIMAFFYWLFFMRH